MREMKISNEENGHGHIFFVNHYDFFSYLKEVKIIFHT